MVIKIATKVFNEEQFIDTFIQYYLNLGISEIHFFDSGSTDQTVPLIKQWCHKNSNIKLIISSPKLRHTSYSIETAVCNQVLQHTIQNTKESNQECWWLFPDIDEFLNPPREGLDNFLSNRPNDFVRCIFFEWYRSPEQANTSISIKQMLDYARQGKLKGRLLNIFGDPFYKDFVIHFTPENIQNYLSLRTIAGNHRYILNDEVIIPANEPFLTFDHLRGLSLEHIEERVKKGIQLLKEQHQKRYDAWTYVHFSGIKEDLHDYIKFYNKLLTHSELEAKKHEIASYDNSTSIYNTIIS